MIINSFFLEIRPNISAHFQPARCVAVCVRFSRKILFLFLQQTFFYAYLCLSFCTRRSDGTDVCRSQKRAYY